MPRKSAKKDQRATDRKIEEYIAERDKAETALQEAKETLEVRIEERTADIQSTNLQLQKEITERKKVEETVQAQNEELRMSEERITSHQ